MTTQYGPITSCQSCGKTDLHEIISLGYLPPCNVMREVGKPSTEEVTFPADLLYCQWCHLVQIGYAPNPEIIFPSTYPYTSGSTRILRENFANLYVQTDKLMELKPNDLIVDIGSNDGTLLSNFRNGGHRVIGVEPTLTYKLAEDKGITSLNMLFGKEAVDRILATAGKARVVTAANVFAHIHNVHDVIDQIERLLEDDGVFISESHYLGGLLETNQYDTIYHEHLRYYSYTSLQNLLATHGLHIFKVEQIQTHGGSIRVYASKSKKWFIEKSVNDIFDWEIDVGLTTTLDRAEWIPKFRNRVVDSKLELYRLITGIRQSRQRIVGIGAPSRASTLISYTGLDDSLVSAVLEISTSKKLNKYMPGTKIPILDEELLYREQPEWALLLSWHIADEMIANLKKKGYKGYFIVPLPMPKLVKNR